MMAFKVATAKSSGRVEASRRIPIGVRMASQIRHCNRVAHVLTFISTQLLPSLLEARVIPSTPESQRLDLETGPETEFPAGRFLNPILREFCAMTTSSHILRELTHPNRLSTCGSTFKSAFSRAFPHPYPAEVIKSTRSTKVRRLCLMIISVSRPN